MKKKSFKRGDIVEMEFAGELRLPDQYVITAVPPNNGLHKGRRDIIRLKDAKKPLTTRGVGVPTKYLVSTGKSVL